MKVKCQYCGGNGTVLVGFGMMEEQDMDKCPECEGTGTQDAEISTPALIEELEKRRPQCHYSTCKNMGSEVCGGCLWNTCMGDKLTDNFKPAK